MKITKIIALMAIVFRSGLAIADGDIVAPIVPGTNIESLGSDDIIYIYNVEADAFVNYGMNWNTNAIATRLCNGDYTLSERHQCKVEKQSDGTYSLKNVGNWEKYIGTNSGVNDVWVDFEGNRNWTITSNGTNTYNIKYGANLLDVSFLYGGHLTTKSGKGNTIWAFILPESITDGSYALYKEKKRFYDLYNSFVDAGVSTSNSAMVKAANTYNGANVTIDELRSASQTLFKSLYTNLKETTNITAFLTNADMLGSQNSVNWSETSFTYNLSDIEYYHNTFTLSQTVSNLPNGMYTVELRSLSRQDGSADLPTLSAKGSAEVKGFLPDMRKIDWKSNNGGSNGWKLDGAYYRPNNMLSAGQAMTSEQAVARAEYAPVSGELTITLSETSTSNWDNFQSFDLLYTPISKYYDIKKTKAELAISQYNGKAAPGVINGLRAQLNAIKENNTSSAMPIDAYRCGSTIDKLADNAEETIEPYKKLKSLTYLIQDFNGDASSLVSPMKSANSTLNNATTAAELNAAYDKLYKAYLEALFNQSTDGSDLPDMLIAKGYYARGSQDIFGRFDLPENIKSSIEQGLIYSTKEGKLTINNFEGKSTETINYCGTIYKIIDLTPSTAYWVRPYAKVNDKITIYGPTTKVYTLPIGGVSYIIRETDNTEYDNNIRNAVSTMTEYWNRYTNIQGYTANAGYKSGVPTAECSYGGWMSFGSNTSYQQCGTAMHESMHGIGVGTTSEWNTLCNGKNWIGPRVNEFIQFWENKASATFYGDAQHGWCANSNGELSYTINGAHEDKYNDLQRTANSLLTQAMGEDGLRPTSGSWLFSPYYSFEQNDHYVYYITNKNTGEYLIDNDGELATSTTKTSDAQWFITFEPSDQTYRITSRRGNQLSHENYTWGLNVWDKRIVMPESTARDSYWLTTPTTDGKCLNAQLKCVNTDLTGHTSNNDWKITCAGKISLEELVRLVNNVKSNKTSTSTFSNDLNANGKEDIEDVRMLVDLLLSVQ